MSTDLAGRTRRSIAYHNGATRDAPHFLYRCYDADSALLYIGCTSDVKRRLDSHQRGDRGSKASLWLAACMVRYEVEGPFRDRDAGRAAERQAIQSEQPLFNFQERNGVGFAASMTRPLVAAYLVKHGHLTLAIETACCCWRDTRDAGEFDDWCPAHIAAYRAAS